MGFGTRHRKFFEGFAFKQPIFLEVPPWGPPPPLRSWGALGEKPVLRPIPILVQHVWPPHPLRRPFLLSAATHLWSRWSFGAEGPFPWAVPTVGAVLCSPAAGACGQTVRGRPSRLIRPLPRPLCWPRPPRCWTGWWCPPHPLKVLRAGGRVGLRFKVF